MHTVYVVHYTSSFLLFFSFFFYTKSFLETGTCLLQGCFMRLQDSSSLLEPTEEDDDSELGA